MRKIISIEEDDNYIMEFQDLISNKKIRKMTHIMNHCKKARKRNKNAKKFFELFVIDKKDIWIKE